MHPQKQLPKNYQEILKLDLSQDRSTLLKLNLFGVALVFISGLIFSSILFCLRSGDTVEALLIASGGGTQGRLFLLVGIIIAFILLVVVHEAVHGLCFWLITHEKPAFGFRGGYAFAAAPNWYLPRAHYLLTCLAPLLILTPLGTIILLNAPSTWIIPTLFFLSMHTGGAAGDLYVAAILLSLPGDLMARDEGDIFTLYQSQ